MEDKIILKSVFEMIDIHTFKKEIILKEKVNPDTTKTFLLYDESGKCIKEYSRLEELLDTLKSEKTRLGVSSTATFKEASKWMGNIIKDVNKLIKAS